MKELVERLKFKDFLAKFKKTPVYQKNYLYPKKDWFFIVIFFVVGSFVVAVITFFLFMKVDSGVFWRPDENVSIKIYKLNNINLKKVVDIFNQKESNFKDIQYNGVDIKSPFQ